jgi:hypothetical protein
LFYDGKEMMLINRKKEKKRRTGIEDCYGCCEVVWQVTNVKKMKKRETGKK